MITDSRKLFSNTVVAPDDKNKKQIYTTRTGTLDKAITESAFSDESRLLDNVRNALPDLFNWKQTQYKLKGEDWTPLTQFTGDDPKQPDLYALVLQKAGTTTIAKYGAETVQLLRTCGAIMSRVIGTKTIDGELQIHLKDYAEARGYPIKTKDNVKDFRDKVRKELAVASATSVRVVKGANTDMTYNVFEYAGISNGIVKVRFTQKIQETFFSDNSQIKYANINALQLRNEIAVVINNYLETRYSIDRNTQSGKNNIISVESLLDLLKNYLPTEVEAGKDLMKRRGKPIITALDEMADKGVLTSWVFCKARKEPMTMAEAKQCRSEYKTFKSAYIHFEMAIGQDESYQARKDTLEKKNQRTKAKK